MTRGMPQETLALSEIISALSYALDITGGQPPGHAARSCAIGMRIAEAAGVPEDDLSSLYYALLLKDAGCSANAPVFVDHHGDDDRHAKRELRRNDHRTLTGKARYALRTTLPGGSPVARARKLRAVARSAGEFAQRGAEVRCERGATIAAMMELPESAGAAIRALDEHWDGGGHPYGLRGTRIPLAARIMQLAQTVEVFFTDAGLDEALDVVATRSGRWFDPDLVSALLSTRGDRAFWSSLAGDPVSLVVAYEPVDRVLVADDEHIDRVAEAFAAVVDAKSPYTGRHSARVAQIAVGVAVTLGMDARRVRDLRRAALLHDIGKLGVSNLVLDKPGRLDEDEWRQMRRHPELTVRILERVPALHSLAADAGAHHERLDGGGYHLGLTSERLGWMPRVLAVADVYEALTADRPYRGPLAADEALGIMRRDVGKAFCPERFAGLEAWLAGEAPFVATTVAAVDAAASPAPRAPQVAS